MPKVDASKIPLPSLSWTSDALREIFNIWNNDYTLINKGVRIQISGKGCSGFEYSLGFDSKREDDFCLTIDSNSPALELFIDPFTAFYLKQGRVDFFQDLDRGEEGFFVENLNQAQFEGKFWRDDPHLEPPTL